MFRPDAIWGMSRVVDSLPKNLPGWLMQPLLSLEVATWGQVRQFCIAQGYAERRGDHDRYLKVVGGRHSCGTMISHGVDGETVPTQMWLNQLREP